MGYFHQKDCKQTSSIDEIIMCWITSDWFKKCPMSCWNEAHKKSCLCSEYTLGLMLYIWHFNEVTASINWFVSWICVSPPTGHVLPLHPRRRGIRKRGGRKQETPDEAQALEWDFPWERQRLWIPNGTRGSVNRNKRGDERTRQRRRRREKEARKLKEVKQSDRVWLLIWSRGQW